MWGSSASDAYGSGGRVNAIVFSSMLFSAGKAASLFKSASEAEHAHLVEVSGQNLHADRETGHGVAARHAHAGNTGQIAGDRVDIRQIHFHRIVGLFAQLERRRRGYRSDNSVHFTECIVKILRDQSADLLGLQIVSIVITRAENVSSQHDAPFALSPKALPTRKLIHFRESFCFRRADRVSYSVVAGEIGTRLGRADDVVTCNRVLSSWQVDLMYLAA